MVIRVKALRAMPGVFCAIVLAAVPGLAAAECKVTNYGVLPVEVVGQRATTMAKINGQDTRFILDTGATFGFMARANVEAMGLRREPAPFGLRMGGIGGSFSPELTRVKSFGILNGTLSNIEFLVGGSDAGTGLIGANLLDVVDADVDLASGRFALLKPVGCEKLAMAYWTKDGQYSQTDLHPAGNTFDRRSFVTVTINGHPVRAMLDSGAMATVITRRAAERSGMDMSAAGPETAMRSRGVGSRTQKAWVVPVESYSIGEETVHHGKLEVIDDVMGEGPDTPDMLLGIDFFLSHHIFIANSQRKLYFTYNGGRLFTMGSVPKGAAQAAVATSDDEPKTAAAFALRGQARLSRGEGALALADLEQAVSLDGNVAAYRLARARARLAAGKAGGGDPVGAALADLDAALRLDAQNLDALLLRAQLRFARKDREGAAQDIAAARALVPAGSNRSRELASFYVAVDRPAEALPLLDEWVRLHREDSQMTDVLATRCWARGLANVQLDGALDDCRRALAANRERASVNDSMGLILLRLGRNADAQASYEKAVALDPRSAWSHYGLGLARIRNGQDGQAELAAATAIAPRIAERAGAFGLKP